MHKFVKPKPLTLALSRRKRGLKAIAVLRNTTNRGLGLGLQAHPDGADMTYNNDNG